ncbi:MAG: GntR family transcriptional regulator [Oscillospiraceae bacterium]|nr:GntR family transcriptional regulator [Oscillospiraceae bacterium]
MNYLHELSCPKSGLMSNQISAQLLRELREGQFAAADRLPSETALAQYMGVSRTVIRDALSDLEREGLVERVRGIGTVINHTIVKLDNRLDLKEEYYDLIHTLGYESSSDNIHLRTEPASGNIVEDLQISENDPLIVCEKRVLAGGRPVIYSIDYIPRNLIDLEDYTGIDWSQPVFDILERYCGIVVDSSICRVRAISGPGNIRKLLELKEEDALLELDEVGRGKMGRPVLFSIGYYTDFFDFTMLRKKI